jgi:hypothetical protein
MTRDLKQVFLVVEVLETTLYFNLQPSFSNLLLLITCPEQNFLFCFT